MIKRFLSVVVFFMVFLGVWSVGGGTAAYRAADESLTTLVSRHSNGTLGNDYSADPTTTPDGRFVAFASLATNLTNDPLTGPGNIFLHDRLAGQTTLVSKAMDGSAAGSAGRPAIAAAGGFIVYESASGDMVPDDTNDEKDIFVLDRAAGRTFLVSRHTDGTIGDGWSILPAISGNGRFVVFVSTAANLVDQSPGCCMQVYLHDRETGQTTLISQSGAGVAGNGDSTYPDISTDGRYVVFETGATNIVTPDDNGGTVNGSDILVYDRQTGEMTRVSRHTNGMQADGPSVIPAVSGNGRYVAFQSFSTNLVDDDVNDMPDVFVHDRQTGETVLVSRHSDGTQGDSVSDGAALSDDGRYVAFNSTATTLVDAVVSGRNSFRHELQTGETILVSRRSDGTPGNATGYPTGPQPVAVANTGAVAFESGATNLVDGDINEVQDVFVNAPPLPGLDFMVYVPVTNSPAVR